MKTLISALLSLSAVALALPAQAGPKAEALSACMTDNTTGKERKELARWVFAAMSVHPDIRELSQPSEAVRIEADQAMARLVTGLIAERCAVQAREAVQQEGSSAMAGGFRALGELAMRELMSNPEVAKSLGAYERYVDQAKFRAAFAGQ